MFDIETTLLGLTAALDAGLCLFAYFGERRSPINRSFAVFALCLSLWALLHIGFRVVGSDALAGELLKLSYVCALLIGASFYYFSIVFPAGERPRSLHAGALLVMTVLLLLALLSPVFLVGAVMRAPYGRSAALLAPDYFVFAAIFGALFLGGQLRIWLKYRSAVGLARTQLLAIGTSVTTIGLIGMYFDLVLPSPFLENFRYVWTGPVFTSLFAIAITYTIFRFRLFNLKAALTELLIFAWWLFILARTLVAASPADALLDVALLAVSAPIGTLLLRSLKLEAQTRAALAEANDSLREADQMKSELLALATHQLRQPVVIVRSYASMLEDGLYGTLPAAAREPIERILHSSTQMAEEITDYLSVAKIDQGQLHYSFKTTDLGRMISELLHDLQPLASQKRLRLIYVPDHKAKYAAQIDAGKIQQVLSNLIDNAIRYTPQGSVTVSLAEGKRPGWVLITVRDTGMGIDPETLPRLFQRYSRAKDMGRLHAEGSGLGLYLARQFVEGHAGRISATSDGAGTGASFSIELPVRQPPGLTNVTA